VSKVATDIEAVLRESGPDYEDFSYERPTAGHQGEVFLVTLTHSGEEYEVVVKFQPGNQAGFALEPFLHEYVADRTDVPVPRILVFKAEPDLDVPPYFVTERVQGRNLAESLGELEYDLRERLVAQAGRILGDMHAEIGFEGFGRLGLEGERLIVEDLSWDWRDTFRSLVDVQIDRLAGGPFENMQQRAHRALDESIGVIPTGGVPRLVHDDFRPANMLFDPATQEPITAVLDWQFALAGHPEYHLARTDFLFIDPAFQDATVRQELRSHLYEGYRTYRDFDPDDQYERRRPVYHFATLLWRMAGFEAAFADASGLARARYEARFRQQFDQLVASLPEA
jgi:aminoglycoside phosphotransferase (APT) family kinase protein